MILTTILIAAPIRIAAYRNLGKNFTFILREPDGLVTTGIHGYIQHPSYVGLVLTTIMMLWVHRVDTLVACLLPPWLLQPLTEYQILWLVGGTLVICGGMYVRVREEERMMKAAFGKEWEEYRRRTKRFIPGVF